MASTILWTAIGVAFAASVGPACTDPVRDTEIDQLGDEEAGIPPGPEHRPGQPCLHCHSSSGPASSHPFAIAGTIYETQAFDSPGAENITVQFIDANNGAPRTLPVTNAVGNFFVLEDEWPDIAFPIRVGIYKDDTKPPTQTMKSLINREGSCNFCHRRNIDPNEKLDPEDKIDFQVSAGQIYVTSSSTEGAGGGGGDEQQEEEEDP